MSGELSDAEREAMEGAWINTYADGVEPLPMSEGGEHAVEFKQGWLAARDYYKAEQRAERERLEEMVQKPRLEGE